MKRWSECGAVAAGVLFVAAMTARATGQVTERVSIDSGGAAGNDSSLYPSISADARFVAFWSWATNLVNGDTNGRIDVFVHDRQTGATERVSLGPGGTQGNGDSHYPSISADGRYVAFWSYATNLVSGDTNTAMDIFVRDRQSGTTERVSLDSSGVQGNRESLDPSISADGRYVAFRSYADNLVSGDANGVQDAFVRDRLSSTTERVSLDSLGTQGNGDSFEPSISADGRYVAFQSFSTNLVSGDTNGQTDVFVRDRQSGTTERVSVDSVGTQGNGFSYWHSISADGRYVAFRSYADNLVSGDTNGQPDVFVHDRQNGTTERASVGSGGVQGNGISYFASISADGRYVAFASEASDLVSGDTNGQPDVFVRDRRNGTTERVSVDSVGAQGNGFSYWHSISADGRYVAFYSYADNLVGGDTNGMGDVFVRTRGPAPMVTSRGHNCAAPYLTWSGNPALGEDYTVTTVNLGLNSQVLLVDWSNIPGRRPPLRAGFACQIYIPADSMVALGNVPDYTFSIPTDPALLGVHLRTQARVLSSPVVTTQVLDARIGQ